MEKKNIITIAGKPGSGKSTTSKMLATDLKFEHFSSGDLFRAIGKKRGIDVLATNKVAEDEKEIDYLVDERLRVLGTSSDNLVIDSRMAWHWMPYSFRVYLNLDLTIAATRIINNMDEERRAIEFIPDSIPKYALQLESRLQSEAKRYQSLYNVNPYDINNYDLVVDTGQFSIPEVEQMILESYQFWLK